MKFRQACSILWHRASHQWWHTIALSQILCYRLAGGLTLLQRREHRLVFGHISWSITVRIVDFMAAEQHMPQVGIEFNPRVLAAALNLDFAEPFIPLRAGFLTNAVKVPMRALSGQVVARILDNGVGATDLDQQRLLRSRFIRKRHACLDLRMIAKQLALENAVIACLNTLWINWIRKFGDLRQGFSRILPAIHARDRTVKFHHKEHMRQLRNSPQAVRHSMRIFNAVGADQLHLTVHITGGTDVTAQL